MKISWAVFFIFVNIFLQNLEDRQFFLDKKQTSCIIFDKIIQYNVKNAKNHLSF